VKFSIGNRLIYKPGERYVMEVGDMGCIGDLREATRSGILLSARETNQLK